MLKIEKKRIIIRIAILMGFAILFFSVLFLILHVTGFFDRISGMSQQEIAMLIKNWSWASVPIFILIQALQALFLPVPEQVVTGIGMYVFGTISILWSMIGILLGAFTLFFIGRVFGLKAARWIVGQELLDKYYQKVEGKNKRILYIMFFLPFMPSDLLCLVAGLSKAKIKHFCLVVFFSRLIQTLATVFLASYLEKINFQVPLSGWGIVFWVCVAVAVVAGVGIGVLRMKVPKGTMNDE